MKQILEYLFDKKKESQKIKEDNDIDYKKYLRKLRENFEKINLSQNNNNEYIEILHEKINNDNNNGKIIIKNKLDIDIDIEKQKMDILEEKIKKRNEWINNMESNIYLSPNDSIISTKLLVSEAFRRNPHIKKKYYRICNRIFENNTNPKIIKSLILRLQLFTNKNE
jgi:hypothetical protein